MLILVIGDGLGNFALKPVHGEVNLGDVDSIAVLLLAVKDDSPGCIATLVLNEVAGLDEHAARAAGRIENSAVVRLKVIDDGLDQRRGREDLPVIVGLLDG